MPSKLIRKIILQIQQLKKLKAYFFLIKSISSFLLKYSNIHSIVNLKQFERVTMLTKNACEHIREKYTHLS